MTARRPALVPLAIALGVGVSLALLAVFVRDHAYRMYDDAFIFLRYVKNVRAGCGLRFNCDDPPVEGFTSPVYLALLVAGSLVTWRLVTLTQVVCTVAVAGVLVAAIGGAAMRWSGEGDDVDGRDRTRLAAAMALAVAALLGLDHYVLANAVLGLETPVTALVVTLMGLAVLTDRRRAALVLALVAFLCRPECLLLLVLLPMLPWARRLPVVATLVGFVLAVTLVRWLVFHDFVPNTYWAKAGGTLRHAELGAAYIGELFGDHFPFIVLAPLALLVRGARRAVAYLLVVSGTWIAFFLRTGGDVFLFSRLAFPLVPLLTVLAARGVAEAARRALRRTSRGPTIAPGVLLAVAAGFSARAAWAHHLPTDHADPKVLRWTALGEYLRDRYPGKTIATVPIGAIAYYSRLHVIDMLGLTTPAIAKAGRTLPPELLQRNWIGHERHCLECVLDLKPDLVVTTQFRAEPWSALEEARAGFYAEWLFVRAVKDGAAPYHIVDAPIAPNIHFLMFQRDGE